MDRGVSQVVRSCFLAIVCSLLCQPSLTAQQSQATLRGQVTDPLGAIVVGAQVTAIDATGVEKTATTNQSGEYVFPSLPPGRYTIRVSQTGFAPFENPGVEITAGRMDPMNIVLTLAVAAEEVTVQAEQEIGTEPESNVGAVVLRGTDLDALPDDPDDLAEALQALAGPSAGPDGEGEMYIDGFSGGRLPPKESIREVRVNRNPFSAEYDRLGYGRIEIFTKPGTDKFRGQAFFNFNDESLNSRSPFALVRAPYQSRRYGGNVSGPLIAKKMSYFLDFERRDVDDNSDVNAIILDENFTPVPYITTVLTPTRRTTFSPRLDWQLGSTNTLVARYTFDRSTRENQGVGGFNLPSRAYNTQNDQHTVQLTYTTVINQNIINETRMQYVRQRLTQTGGSFAPTIRVNEAFVGGGSQIGQSYNNEDRLELQNFTSWVLGRHSLKAGARLRTGQVSNASESNFAGTWTFTTIEQYRLAEQGIGIPAQFSLNAGNPLIGYRQTDISPFVQDDWRVRPNLTLSFGLRYDWQKNIHSSNNFAPRIAFAWSPGSAAQGRRQTTVVRGGFGIFYTPFNESLISQSERYNGINQQAFLITNTTPGGPAILSMYPNVPTPEELAQFTRAQTIRQMSPDIRTPYTMQSSISFERALPYKTTMSVSFISANTRNLFRSRNINAPLPGTNVLPDPSAGPIYQFESTGRFDQQQLIVSINNRFSQMFSIRSTYVLNRARSDTEGLGTFPINQYDLSGEYGSSLQDVRHRFTIFGSINGLPWGIRLSPFINAYSGRPFNITIGRDLNFDTLFTERPAFATDLNRQCNFGTAERPNIRSCVVHTRWGNFDILPIAGQTIIPRNYGRGPGFATVNLRVSKAFGFGGEATGPAGQGGGRRGGGGGGRRGGFGGGDGAEGRSRYNLTLSANIQNLFNWTNEGTPVGNLTSPFFGQSTSSAGSFGRGGGTTAGNRRIDLQLRFSF